MSRKLNIHLQLHSQYVFDTPFQGGEAMTRLFSFHQGSSSVADYSIQFLIYAAESRWNGVALQGAFLTGLNEEVKDHLAGPQVPDFPFHSPRQSSEGKTKREAEITS